VRLNSTAFADGSAIPQRFSYDGDDVPPPLSWSDVPTGTRSFVLLCDDPDAPAGTWHHWAAFDIPSTVSALAEHAASDAEKGGFKQAVNDFRRPGYGGPCPPRGHGRIIIIFGCSRCRAIVYRSPARRPVARSSARRANTLSRKQPWSAFTNDDGVAPERGMRLC
jgi:Raf kinase inhibitor-like YbhB/YbcL family protein